MKVSDRRVRLETIVEPPRTLANHRILGLNEGRADILRVTRSPDGSHLAYVVHALRGGTFVAQSRGFLLDVSGAEPGSPGLLADPMSGPLAWHPTQRLALGLALDSAGEATIYQWSY